MVNGVLNNSVQHRFVRVIPPWGLLLQILDRKILHPPFQQIPALIPQRHQIVPWNRRFPPFLFRFVLRHRIVFIRSPNALVPEQQMLQQLRNRMCTRAWPFRCLVRRNLRQQFRDRGAVPCAFDRHRAIRIGNSLGSAHESPPSCKSDDRIPHKPAHPTEVSSTIHPHRYLVSLGYPQPFLKRKQSGARALWEPHECNSSIDQTGLRSSRAYLDQR